MAGVAATLFVRADTVAMDTFSFDNPLHIPPLAPSRLDGEGRRVFDLATREARPSSSRDVGPPPGASTAATWAQPFAQSTGRRCG